MNSTAPKPIATASAFDIANTTRAVGADTSAVVAAATAGKAGSKGSHSWSAAMASFK